MCPISRNSLLNEDACSCNYLSVGFSNSICNYLKTEFIQLERYNLPSTRNYLTIRLYFHIAVYLSIWHHHVGFTCIVTIGIRNPHVVNIFTFYVKSTVKPASQARVCPLLAEIAVHFKFLVTLKKRKSIRVRLAITSMTAELTIWRTSKLISSPWCKGEGVGRIHIMIKIYTDY